MTLRRATRFLAEGSVVAPLPLWRRAGLYRDANTEQIGVPDDRAYIAPAFTWKPDEDTKLTILGEYSRTKSGGTAAYYNTTDAQGRRHITDYFTGDPSFNDFIQHQGRLGWEFEHTFDSGLTFRQNFRVSKLDVDAQFVASDGTNPQVLPSGGFGFTCYSVSSVST